MKKPSLTLVPLGVLFSGALFVISLFAAVIDPMAVRQNETSAAQAVNQIRTMQTSYAAKHRGNYAQTFGELIRTQGLDEKFDCEKPLINGYVFEIKIVKADAQKPAFYSLTADPVVVEERSMIESWFKKRDVRHFYTDSTLGTIRATDENRPATAVDPSI